MEDFSLMFAENSARMIAEERAQDAAERIPSFDILKRMEARNSAYRSSFESSMRSRGYAPEYVNRLRPGTSSEYAEACAEAAAQAARESCMMESGGNIPDRMHRQNAAARNAYDSCMRASGFTKTWRKII